MMLFRADGFGGGGGGVPLNAGEDSRGEIGEAGCCGTGTFWPDW